MYKVKRFSVIYNREFSENVSSNGNDLNTFSGRAKEIKQNPGKVIKNSFKEWV